MPEQMRKSASSAGICGRRRVSSRYWRRRRNVASCLHRRNPLLAHKDETLEYKRQLAELGDKIEHQKRLNELVQQAEKFAQQQRQNGPPLMRKAGGD